MKRFLTMLAFLPIMLMGSAQNVLEVTDLTEGGDVFSNPGTLAAVEMRAENGLSLTFKSSADATVNVFRKELQGTDSVYYLAFETQASGVDYRGRVITIQSPGYDPFKMAVELGAHELRTYKVRNPNALVDAGCYRTHRNRGMEEFKNMNYAEAKSQFVIAGQCTDVNEEENTRNMALADTCIMLRYNADASYNVKDYRTASSLYYKLLGLNPYDTYASSRAANSNTQFTDECNSLYNQGEYFNSEKQYDKALVYYNSMRDQNCFNSALATERISQIMKNKESRKNHSHVVTYEYMKDAPIGFSTGTYNMNRWGGFFTLNFNTKIFKAMKKDISYIPGEEVRKGGVKGDYPEVDMSFGWTKKIYAPVWLFFGPGISLKMYYGKYKSKDKDKNYPLNDNNKLDDSMYFKDLSGERYPIDKVRLDMFEYDDDDVEVKSGQLTDLSEEERKNLAKQYDTVEDAWKHTNFAFAVTPTIGVCVKYSYVALRVSYQYRIAIPNGTQNFMGRHRVNVGLGIAF